MDAEKIASLQQQPLNAQDGNSIQQQDPASGVPGGAADGSMQQGGGSFQAGMGGGSMLGVDGVAAQLAMAAGGSAVVGGGSLVLGGDNSTGNVNKKLFVKRSCTEAMLKVREKGGGCASCVRACAQIRW